MKKFLKVTSITVGSIFALIFLAWLIVPALPSYLLIKNHYKNNLECLNYTTMPYTHGDTETPKDFIEAEYEGLYLKMPSGMKNKYADNDEHKALSDRVFTDTENNVNIIFFETDKSDIPSEEYEQLKKLYHKTPENYYELWDIIHTVKFDDLSVFKHKASAAMLAWAEIKSSTPHGSDSTVYKIETENAVGFVSMIGHRQKDEKHEELYKYAVELFDKDDLDTIHSAIIGSKDQETIWQIVNSADIVK